MTENEEYSARPRRFVDEATRLGYETAQAVSRLVKDLPPEGAELKTQRITFAPEHEDRGLTAIFTAGTVIFTGREDGAMLVPERSLQILQKLDIPYLNLP